MDPIVDLVVKIVTVGGAGSAVAFGFLKFFGKAILDTQLKRLEEDYKATLSLEFDRVAKLNQREFEVLPQLWDFVVTIRSQLLDHLNDSKYVTVNLDSFPINEYEKFVESQQFSPHLKVQLLASTNRNITYIAIQNLSLLELCKSNYSDFDLLYKKNKIFLTDAIAESIKNIHSYFFFAIDTSGKIQNDRVGRGAYIKDFENISTPLQDELGVLIKKRLQFKE